MAADPEKERMWGEKTFFADRPWARHTAEDGLSASGRDPNDFNHFWGSLSTQWVSPIDFVSYGDSKIFTEETSFMKRYLTMLYYGQLILFSNELGPVNPNEMLTVLLAILFSTFFQIKVFGDISIIWDGAS